MMKKLLLIATMLWSVAYGQSKVYIRGDSIVIQKVGGNGELILENGTKSVTGGVLTNMGNGRTQFVVPLGGGLFGKTDTIFTENRHVNGRGLYNFLFDSIPDLQINDGSGNNRFQISNVRTKLFSASGNSSIEMGDTLSFTADQYHITDLPEASNMTDKTVMVWDSVTTHLQRISKDSIGGGGGGDLQATTDLGSTTDNPIKIKARDSIGTRFNYDWTTGSFSSWIDNTATATVTAAAGKTTISGGALNLSNNLAQLFYVGVENWTATQTVVAQIKNNTSFGFGFRFAGSVGSAPDVFAHFLLSDTAGYMAMTAGNVLPTYSSSLNSRAKYKFVWSAGDSLDVTIQKVVRTVYMTVTNRANGSEMKLTYRECPIAVGTISWYFYGGDWDFIGNFRLVYNEVYQPKIAWLGDSNMWGVSPNTLSSKYVTQVMNGIGGGFINMSAPFEQSLQGWYRTDDVVLADPDLAIIAYAVNDRNSSVNIDSFSNRIVRTVDRLQANGIAVALINGVPQTSGSIVTFNDTLQAIATRKNALYIDIYGKLVAAAGTAMHANFNSGDGVHINVNGSGVIAPAIVDKIGSYLTADVPFTASPLPVFSDPQFLVGIQNGKYGRVYPDSSTAFIRNNLYTAGISNGQVADIHIDGTGNIGGRFQANGNGTDANPNFLVDAGTTTVANFSASSGHFTVSGGQTSVTSNWLQFPNGTAFIRTTGNGSMRLKTGISGAGSGSLGVCASTEGSLPSVNFKPFVVQISDSNKAVFDRWGGLVLNWNSESTTKFQVKGDNDSAALYVNATSDNTGLGTISPEEKLHVVGKVKITDVPAAAAASLDSVTVMEDGRVKALVGFFAEGTYTPTLTNVTNIASSTAYALQYMKVGSTVTVSGKVEFTATTDADTQSQLDFSLPFASNFTTDGQCGGAGAGGMTNFQNNVFGFKSDATNDRVSMNFLAPTNGGTYIINFSFTYRIL